MGKKEEKWKENIKNFNNLKKVPQTPKVFKILYKRISKMLFSCKEKKKKT